MVPAVQVDSTGGVGGCAGGAVPMGAHCLCCVGEGTSARFPGDGAPAGATGGLRAHIGWGTWGCMGRE